MSDWEDDPDEPDESEMDFGDSADLRPCPSCRKPIYDEAEVCPHCGNYVGEEKAKHRKPLWFVLAAIIIIATILLRWIGHR
jgi:predicted nucleic acid-binding Zn ribbon protein